MASLITVRIDKGNSPNLGFRLQGGKDFGTPLVIQKVNGGSPAERAGLIAGDSVIKINNIDVYNLRHKDAQDVVVKSGNSFDISVQRGGSTWKPAVIPTGSIHSPASNFNNVSPVTKTSLAANRSDNIGSIGTGHNVSAKPFSPQVNGAVNGGPKLVNKQYNTPLKLYSEESIAETLSAQTEVLSTGALGVNFKKNERNYDASNSEVLRALKESESDPNYQDQEPDSGVVTTPNSGIAGLRHVQAPENRPRPSTPQLPPGQNICADCERLIVGVFVRIKDKNLHVECFKCSTCGSSLKNVGYYNINNKLYCDIHAKSAALKNQSNPNLVPVTVPPGSKAPANAISSALSSHSYPSPSPLSPKLNISGTPYQAEETKENVDVASSLPNLVQSNVTESNINNNNTLYSSSTPLSFSNYLNKSSNFAGPKPFSSISAPLSPHNTLPKAAPLSPVAPAPAPTFNNSYSPSAYSPSSVQVTENIVWPPPQETTQVPTACPLFYPPPSQIEQSVIQKRRDKQKVVEEEEEDTENCPEIEQINAMARFISGGSYRRRSTEEVKETLAETLDTQMLVENIVKTRVSPAVPPVDADIPQCIRVRRHSEQKENPKEITINQQSFKESGEFKETSKVSPIPNIDVSVPLKWESPLTQAIRTTSPDKDTFPSLPIAKHTSSSLASALKVAPAEPFKPTVINEEAVPLPEETIPYFPPERPVLSDEPPIRKKKYGPADKLLEDLPEPIGKLTLRDALLTAPDRPFSPFVENAPPEKEKEKKKPEVHVEPLKPDILPPLFETHKKDPKPPTYYPPVVLSEEGRKTITTSVESQQFEAIKSSTQTSSTRSEQIVINENQNVIQNIGPIFQGFSCSFQNKGDISQFSVDVRTTPPIISPPPIKPLSQTIDTKTETITNQKQSCEKSEMKKGTREVIKHAEEIIPVKAVPPVTLRKPKQLPQYQVELSAEAESELLMLERKRKAEVKTEQQKSNIEQTQQKVSIEQTQQKVCPPVIKVETENNNTFKPLIEERLLRPGSGMSSRTGMTSPALLPYYQTNLVPQKMIAAHSSVFDPKSPGTSRSPSPYPAGGRDRSPSPLPGTKSNVRAVSPAPGPPENPLKSSTPLPTPETIRIDQARESLTSYLPEYKIRRDQLEESQDIGLNKQMYTSVVQTQNYPIYPLEDNVVTQKSDFLESQRSEKKSLVEGENIVAISREEQMKQAHLEAKKQSHSQSVETSADGLTRVQRKRVVTEEYERSQKEVNVQIEKNVTSTKKYPFSDAKPPSLELSNTRGHVTDPQRMSSSFLKTGCAQIEHCLKQRNPNLPAASSNQHDLAPSSAASSKHVSFPSSSNKPNVSSVSQPDVGTTSGRQTGGVRVAPRRGRGILNPAAIGGARIPLCGSCNMQVRGPFITALGKIWCPNHFICSTQSCRRPLQDIGFVEERGQLYCEYCFEQYLAPPCSKCGSKIKGDCLKAIGKNFHPECFNCTYCGKLFGNNPFFLEDGSPYCEADWNELFTTKCFACAFPIEAGDRWVEALNNNYHSQCFNCTMCKKNLEGQSFFAKGGRPFCKNHAR